MKNKKAEVLGMSFGMIFSIMLIIAFIGVAIYAISVFLNIKTCGQIGLFKEDLQKEINRAWGSDESSFIFSSILPGKIEEACFIDLNSAGRGAKKDYYTSIKKQGYLNMNLFFWPLKNSCDERFEIEHINLKSRKAILADQQAEKDQLLKEELRVIFLG